MTEKLSPKEIALAKIAKSYNTPPVTGDKTSEVNQNNTCCPPCCCPKFLKFKILACHVKVINKNAECQKHW